MGALVDVAESALGGVRVAVLVAMMFGASVGDAISGLGEGELRVDELIGEGGSTSSVGVSVLDGFTGVALVCTGGGLQAVATAARMNNSENLFNTLDRPPIDSRTITTDRALDGK